MLCDASGRPRAQGGQNILLSEISQTGLDCLIIVAFIGRSELPQKNNLKNWKPSSSYLLQPYIDPLLCDCLMIPCSARVSASLVPQLWRAAPTIRSSGILAMAQPSGDSRDGKKRQFQGNFGHKKQKKQKAKKANKGESTEEVLLADVQSLLAARKAAIGVPWIDHANGSSESEADKAAEAIEGNGTTNGIAKGVPLPEPFTEIDVEVLELSSTGDGLARQNGSDQLYVVPFTAPGDTVKVKVIKHFREERYALVDFVSVVKPSQLRDDSRIKCPYFARCSGCQFQMLDYQVQLEHKKKIVEKAYKNFSDLPPEMIPIIQDTIGSPMQYGYRTKLTPHFDGPPGARKNRNGEHKSFFQEVPPIGFMQKGMRKTIDIEDCPIGTDAVRMGMKRERVRVAEELSKYKRGATILLRESTNRVANDSEEALSDPPEAVKTITPTHTDLKYCITDNNATTKEYIDDFIFTNPAGSFFQNNNSILPIFTSYIREHALPPMIDFTSKSFQAPNVKYLIDAYSGSGLFTVTLSSLFTSSTGIDISTSSITSARQNAELNNLPPSQCKFIAANAQELFKEVTYPPEEMVVVIDPPRKGCDEGFLRQLLEFGPRRVVYVSCNVHTQARDVGVLVRGLEESGESEKEKGEGTRYEIESLRGFDFFPQTGHVEGVAILNKIEGR